jgi:hypothetical protein
MTRPSVNEVYKYRKYVTEAMVAAFGVQKPNEFQRLLK